jgi:hypothetical protein
MKYKIFLEGNIHYKTNEYEIKGELVYFKDMFGLNKVVPVKRIVEITEMK